MSPKLRKRRSSVEPTLRQRLFRCFLWVGLVGVIIFSVFGSLHIRKHVVGEPRYEYANWQIEFVALPTWVTPEIRNKLEGVDLSDEETNLTLFDRGVLDLVKARFEASPWVRSVEGIALSYPTATVAGVIGVDLRLRRPLALVKHEGLHYLVDRGGRRLGSPYREAPSAWFGVPTIVGARAVAPPAEGEEWEDPDVSHGLTVAAILRDDGILDEFADRPIEAVDVANLEGRLRPGDVEIALLWQEARLTWGRSPLSSAPTTVGVEQILHNLRRVLGQPHRFAGYREIHTHRRNLTGLRRAGARPQVDAQTAWPVPSSGPIN